MTRLHGHQDGYAAGCGACGVGSSAERRAWQPGQVALEEAGAQDSQPALCAFGMSFDRFSHTCGQSEVSKLLVLIDGKGKAG